MLIRRAHERDIPQCEQIARQYPHELAFVRRNSLCRAMGVGELHVSVNEDNNTVNGFVLFHQRKDGTSTVYDIAVSKDFTRQGIGRALLYSVPCPVMLKCTVDNETANNFYRSSGMYLASTENGRKRPLNVWKRDTLFIFCAGSNSQHPLICCKAGIAYGCAQNDTVDDWPFMLDVEFVPEKQDWQDFLGKVYRYHPVTAVVTDYAAKEELPRMLSQIDDLRNAGVLRIVVPVKFSGAIDDIPKDCIIGISTPTKSKKFGGYRLPYNDMQKLVGRRVHILGGSPPKQMKILKHVRDIGGIVISVDGNSHQKAATFSTCFVDGRFYRQNNDADWPFGDYNNTLLVSSKNICQYFSKIEDVRPLQYNLF